MENGVSHRRGKGIKESELLSFGLSEREKDEFREIGRRSGFLGNDRSAFGNEKIKNK